MTSPLVIAHRGLPVLAPENTIPSFLMAVQEGATWVELDLRMTADGTLVVLHDATVQRTTDGHGAVHALTFETLRTFDAGTRYHPDFAGTRIPSFRELCESLPASIGMDIELKAPPRGGSLSTDHFTRTLVSELREFGRTDTVVLSSFSLSILRQLRTLDSRLRLGYLDHGRVGLPQRLEELLDFKVEWYIRNILTLTRGIAETVQQRNLTLASFTVNSPRAWKKARELGVSCIITDDVRNPLSRV